MNLSRTLTVPSPTTVITDGLGARAARPQPGRPDHRAGRGAGPRRRRSDRRAGLGLRRRRRRSGHRVDGTAAGRAAQDAADADAQSARPTQVTGLRIIPSGPRCPHTRRWWPSTSATGPSSVIENIGCSSDRRTTQAAVETARHRHRHDQPARLGRRHRPHRARLRPAQAAGAGRDRGAGRDGRPIAAADAARNRAARSSICLRARPDHRRWRDSSSTPRSPPRSARCSTAIRCPPSPADRQPIMLPAGQQELLISPGRAVRGRRRAAGWSARQPIAHGDNHSRAAPTGGWGPARREVR